MAPPLCNQLPLHQTVLRPFKNNVLSPNNAPNHHERLLSQWKKNPSFPSPVSPLSLPPSTALVSSPLLGSAPLASHSLSRSVGLSVSPPLPLSISSGATPPPPGPIPSPLPPQQHRSEKRLDHPHTEGLLRTSQLLLVSD